MPRFVILRHDAPQGVHWDFMLEHEGVLLTWSLPAAPDAHGEQAATALPEHRLAYLDYEGVISGGRGTVTRWDQGRYEWLEQTPSRRAVRLHGARLCGQATLTQEPVERSLWRYCFVPDAAAPTELTTLRGG